MSSAGTDSATPGDLVIISGHHGGEPEQMGEILEVFGTDRQHYRVGWEDGHESLFFPGSDATISHVDNGRRAASPADDRRRHFFERMNAGKIS